MFGPETFKFCLIFFSLINSSARSVRCDDERISSDRNQQSDELDEGSCVCGLSKSVLDRLESIVHLANKQECSLVSITSQEAKPTSGIPATPTAGTSHGHKNDADSPQATRGPDHQREPIVGVNDSILDERTPVQSGHSNDSSTSDLLSQIQALQAQIASLKPSADSNQQPINPAPASSLQNNNGLQTELPATSTITWIQRPEVTTTQTFSQQSSSVSANPQHLRPNQQQQVDKPPGASGFLLGLPPSSSQPDDQAQEQKLETNQVQQAVVTTVPNVVSNIFTNIQDFAIQTEKNPNNVAGSTLVVTQLTSIDGSSAQLNKNDTADQIAAQGEQLFLQWIEHQIQTYHMTASMAAYIRKSALNLFRRIVRQYVQRIERVGGAVESNVRQATQLALHNTQTLISFLLRNYLNFAGGLMQIIGEQVSRVGKQLDSTGDTIAHINLNPFDIVSNVIASLPNPTRYSEYFRAFGKYLMGELSSSQGDNDDHGQSSAQQDQEGADTNTNTNTKRKGLFSKTMGALGKTLSSWIG